MPTVRHPRDREDVAGHPAASVTVRRSNYAIDREGDTATVDLPTDADVRALADAYDLSPDDLALDDADAEDADDKAATCVGADGDCSREVDEPGGTCWQHDDA